MNTPRHQIVAAMIAAASFSTLAHAADTTVRQLADETGLTPRQVQMVLGARTAFPEYRTGYRFVEKQFKDALGAERYTDLMAGRPIMPKRGVAEPAPIADAPQREDAPQATPPLAVR